MTKLKLSNYQKRQELIKQANEKIVIEERQTLRLNWFNEEERKILNWLEKASLSQINQPEQIVQIQQQQQQKKVEMIPIPINQTLASDQNKQQRPETTNYKFSTMDETVQQIIESLERGNQLKIEVDQEKENLENLIKNIISSTGIKIGPLAAKKSVRNLSLENVNDLSKKLTLTINAGIGFLRKEVTLTLVLDNQLNYIEVSSNPLELNGVNIAQKIV